MRIWTCWHWPIASITAGGKWPDRGVCVVGPKRGRGARSVRANKSRAPSAHPGAG
ncbi:hypothetical protein [Lysobacter gummosus]|uniref:hypothetical protein n=1 Tax=Lysobacter gummosus TaxID=262324 RepID=UPI003635BA3A